MNKRGAGQTDARARLREAIHWFVTNESDEHLRQTEAPGWDAWCSRSGNRADYEKVVRLRNQIAALPRPTLPTRDALHHDLSTMSPAVAPPPSGGGVLGRPRRLSSWGRSLVAAASIALIAIAGVFLISTQRSSREVNVELSYATPPGRQQQFQLPDGSTVRLGGNTALLIRFTPKFRLIELDHGEAFFQVRHRARQPFVVNAAGGTTTALGTAFEVRRYAKNVQVWVKEGAVEVTPIKEVAIDPTSTTAKWASVRVAGGEEMTYNTEGDASAPRRADPRVTAAWAEGHLVPLIYRGRTLREVIDEVQMYSRRRIMVDPAAAALEYTGIVIQEDVDAWIRDLPSIYPDVAVIDCRTSKHQISGCSDPERIVIRLRMNPREDAAQSARR